MEKNIVLVVVINGEDKNTGFLGVNEHPGIGYIKSYLVEKGFQVTIKTIFYNKDFNALDYFSPDSFLIGFSTYSDNIKVTLDVAKKLKETYPHIHITLGGPQIITFEEQVLNENYYIDSVISFEGELIFEELAKSLLANQSLKECRGLTYRDENQMIHKNLPRDSILNLDDLPYPSRDIYEKVKQKYLYIVGSRGCLGGCSFCGEASVKSCIKPPYVRIRSAQSVVDEMEYLIKKYKINSFRLTDATFEDPGKEGFERAEEIFNLIIARGLDVSLHLFTRAELVVLEDINYFYKAKKAGVECFYIGVEAGNSTDIKLYNKKASYEISKQAIEKIRKAGIHIGIGFICFNPYSTYETLKENAEFMASTHLGHVFYLMQTRLELLPQAYIKNKLQKDGLVDNFNYLSYFYDYRFIDSKIEELFDIIKKAYKKEPIYYMDTLLEMDRTWSYTHLEGVTRKRIMDLFDQKDQLCEDYSIKNYKFFTECLDMSANNASISQMEKLITLYNLDGIYQPYTDLYNKINIRVTKERLKRLM